MELTRRNMMALSSGALLATGLELEDVYAHL